MACLFFTQFSYAKLMRYDNSVLFETKHSWDKVCKSMTNKDYPLIDKKSSDKLDCMGIEVDVYKFCDKEEEKNSNYSKAYIDKEFKQVICQSSKRVILKWQCQKNDRFCQDLDIGCYLFKEKFARRIKLIHSSFTEEKKFINCYFDNEKSLI